MPTVDYITRLVEKMSAWQPLSGYKRPKQSIALPLCCGLPLEAAVLR